MQVKNFNYLCIIWPWPEPIISPYLFQLTCMLQRWHINGNFCNLNLFYQYLVLIGYFSSEEKTITFLLIQRPSNHDLFFEHGWRSSIKLCEYIIAITTMIYVLIKSLLSFKYSLKNWKCLIIIVLINLAIRMAII